jgi:glycosyltransferase involved in cell wall biosynthesis
LDPLLEDSETAGQLVHAHFAFPQGLFGLIMSRILRAPLVVTVARHQPLYEKSLPQTTRLFRVRACKLSDRGKQANTQCSLAIWNLTSVFIPNCFDPYSVSVADVETFSESILSVGTLTERKRPLLLLQAFQGVVTQVPDAQLIIVGDGPLKDAVAHRIEKLGPQRNIRLRSHVSESHLNRLRAESALLTRN